ncbi:MAG: hypothetical protein LBC31_10515 [Treponema sp.]|jgi:hypothetical protein|nr:hypothetical protein [Treponema sp.]
MTNKGTIFLFTTLTAVFTLAGCGGVDGDLTGNTGNPYPATWLAQQFAAITTSGLHTIRVTENSTETGAIWFDVPGATVTLEGATGNEVITVLSTLGETFLGIRSGKVILKNIKVKYNAVTSESLFFTDSSGSLQIDTGADITSADDIFIKGTFEMTGGLFTYTKMASDDSGLAGRGESPGAGAVMTITGGTVNSTIWAGKNSTVTVGGGSGTAAINGQIAVSGENSTVTVGGGSGTAAITGRISVAGANSSFEKKGNSTITDNVNVSTDKPDLFVIALGPIADTVTLKAKVQSDASAIVDKIGDWKGYFHVKITGIPASIMADGYAGHNRIGMGPAYGLGSDESGAIAGRDTALPGEGDNTGGSGDNRWYEFFMYELVPGNKYLGSAGNYDLGFIVKLGGVNYGTRKVIRNASLKVGELNTFLYTSFGNF